MKHFTLLAIVMIAFLGFGTGVLGQTTIHSNSCSSATANWTFNNGSGGLAIQQSGYWLLDNSSDEIISESFNVSNYTNLTLTFSVATYGSGTNHACRVEYSTDNGATWNASYFTSTTPTSSGYVSAGTWSLGTINSSQFKFRWTTPDGGNKGVRLDNILFQGTLSGLTPPTLNADNTNNNVDNSIDITFADDASWRAAVTAVKVNGTSLSETTDYLLTEGVLELLPSGGNSILQTTGSKNVVIEATGYTNATVTQAINAGAPTTNSTATINLPLATNTTRTVTCTAKDQYSNLVGGYTFKFDLATLDGNATTDENYTVDGTGYAEDASNVNLTTNTNSSGVATFNITIPATVDANDGLMVQVQLADGTTDIGSSFDYEKLNPQITLTGSDPGTSNLQQGSLDNVIYKIAVTVVNDNTSLTELSCITGGNYVAADVLTDGFVLWYSEDDLLGGVDDVDLSNLSSTSTGSGEILTFSGFNQPFNIGTAYLFITASIDLTATVGHTMSGEITANSDLTFSGSHSFGGGSIGSGNIHAIVGAPTVLEEGDIAFIGYATDDPDQFAFLTFVDITENTEIVFTDNGWKADNTWRSGESEGVWTAPAGGIPAGSVIQIKGTTVTGGGTMSVGLTGLSSSGDQVLAYQDNSGSPTFISAINMDWSIWQAESSNSNTSTIPTGLTNNVNANAVLQENGYYNGPTNGTINFLRSAINNPANWITTDVAGQIWPSWSFTFGNNTTLSSSVTLQNLLVGAGETFTLSDGASLITNGTITGTATVNKTLNDANFHLLFPPVNNTVAAAPTFNGYYLDKYVEANGAWTRLTDVDNVTPDQGYSAKFASGSGSLSFTGNLFTGDQTFSNLSYTAGAGGYFYGWNLVGNPFPSAVDLDLGGFDFTGLNGYVYVWNGSNYLAGPTNPGGYGTLTDNIIPPFQGFFVRTENAVNTFTIPQAARVHSSQAFYKEAKVIENAIGLTVSGNNATDKMMLVLNPEATQGYDSRFDAFKLFGNADAPQLFTLVGDQKMSVNTVNTITNDTEFAVMLQVGANGEYTLTAEHLAGFMNGADVYLTDLRTQARQNLSQNPSYSFQANTTDDPYRFKISFASVGVADESVPGIGVFAVNERIVVRFDSKMDADVIVSNLAGQVVAKESLSGIGTKTLAAVVPQGIYLVTVVAKNETITRKVFVK